MLVTPTPAVLAVEVAALVSALRSALTVSNPITAPANHVALTCILRVPTLGTDATLQFTLLLEESLDGGGTWRHTASATVGGGGLAPAGDAPVLAALTLPGLASVSRQVRVSLTPNAAVTCSAGVRFD